MRIKPITSAPRDKRSTSGSKAQHVPSGLGGYLGKLGWPKALFRNSNLKFEAVVFLLLALTFTAVACRDAITSHEFTLSTRTTQYYPFVYDDRTEGGRSAISHDPAKLLQWSCALQAGSKNPYCGYGVFLDVTQSGRGVDLSGYQDVIIKLKYRGTGDRLRLVMQSTIPDALRGKVPAGDVLPMATEFNVKTGLNEVHIRPDELATESWWLSRHGLTPDTARTTFKDVTSVAINSSNQLPGTSFDVEVESITFKGSYVPASQWYLIILGIWIVLTGAFAAYRYLTLRRTYEARRRREAEEKAILTQAHLAAEQASAAKSQFLSNMSHELRTPLNAILGYADLLKNPGLTVGQQQTAVKTIHQSGEHLLALINDILDLSKVEAGKMELINEPFDIRSCVQGVGQMVRLRAEEKGLHFHIDIGADVPQFVIADQKRVRQVLINILSNAIKFTPNGEIRLSASVLSSDDSSVRLRFDVIDTGVGIREDQLGRIFKPFEQAGTAIDRSCGTGLGLSISHHIVDMMQGEITVESTLGKGSVFHIDVPLARVANEEQRSSLQASELDAVPSYSEAEDMVEMIAPPLDVLETLLELARCGNLRGIRKALPEIIVTGPQYAAFCERLETLASTYQSPAVLRLLEHHTGSAEHA